MVKNKLLTKLKKDMKGAVEGTDIQMVKLDHKVVRQITRNRTLMNKLRSRTMVEGGTQMRIS